MKGITMRHSRTVTATRCRTCGAWPGQPCRCEAPPPAPGPLDSAGQPWDPDQFVHPADRAVFGPQLPIGYEDTYNAWALRLLADGYQWESPADLVPPPPDEDETQAPLRGDTPLVYRHPATGVRIAFTWDVSHVQVSGPQGEYIHSGWWVTPEQEARTMAAVGAWLERPAPDPAVAAAVAALFGPGVFAPRPAPTKPADLAPLTPLPDYYARPKRWGRVA